MADLRRVLNTAASRRCTEQLEGLAAAHLPEGTEPAEVVAVALLLQEAARLAAAEDLAQEQTDEPRAAATHGDSDTPSMPCFPATQ